jgi:ribonuclease HII
MHASSSAWPEGLKDSKLVSEKKRGSLACAVKLWSPAHSVGFASAGEIEKLGINPAQALAGSRAIEATIAQLRAKGHTLEANNAIIILDGSVDWLSRAIKPFRVLTKVKADQSCVSVSGASILAKVARDTQMIALDAQYPMYGWASNKGYGAKSHYEAIRQYGMVKGIHRESWIKL